MKVAIIFLLTIVSANSYAGLITFSDRSSFVTATGATGIGALPENANSSSFAVGDLTFTKQHPSSLNTDRNWSTKISESFDLAINDKEQYNVDSGADIFSFGFDFHEPSIVGATSPDTCNATCIDSTFRISLLNGAVAVGAFDFVRPDDILEFVGVWSSDAFNRIEIREIVGGIDNEFFGNFLTGTTPIPEPSVLALFAAGLFGLGFARRRQS